MENNEAKAKYVGEIALILCLQIIMLLFRMVQPIAWPAQVPLVWQNFGNEFIFAGIEFGLIIVIVAHFIFKISFKELGLTHFKGNIGSLIGNLCFVGICVGVSFLLGQFSKIAEFDGLNIGLQIIVNFTMIAFIRELVFRGFLFQAILKLLNGKGILASIISGILFAVTYLPNILMNLNEVHISAILSALAIPLLLGIYLGLIYYYGRNLWLCMIIQGVCLSISTLESDVFINILAGIYSLGLLIYLIYKMVSYYKHKDEEEKQDFNNEVQISRVEVALESENTKENRHNVQSEEIIEATQEVQSKEVEEEKMDIPKVEMTEKVIEPSTEGKEKQALHEEENLCENTVIVVPEFKNMGATPAEKLRHDLQEELDKTMILPNLANEIEEVIKSQKQGMEEEEDLGKVAAIPNTQEELGKVVNLQARKQKKQQYANRSESLDNTVVMPCIEEADIKEGPMKFESKNAESVIEAEPNFIAHLEKYLGDFEGIYKQTMPTEIPIDILCFSGEKCNAIVTNGMRAMTMNVPPELKDYRQTELMMFVDKSFNLSDEALQIKESIWLINLLTDLALYPKQTNGYLWWGHIVGNGEKLEAYDSSVEYCGALIYPPMLQEDVTFYRYNEKGRNIFIYNVMPLFKEELRFIQEHSSDQFINLMSAMGVDQVVKPKRLNVIRNMNR